MAMRALGMATTTIVNQTVVATPTAAIETESLFHHRRMSVDEHGSGTEMIDRIQDCHPGPRQQNIQLMMDRGTAQKVTDPGPVIWTAIDLLQEAELAHHLSIHTSLVMGQIAEEEMSGLQETIDLQEKEMTDLREMIDFRETETTVLEDAMTGMNVAMRIEIEIEIG
jgi:hypothetical protein